MSQVQLTDYERIQAVRRFGYSEREAEFLCQAALHGGYFVVRQYAQFLGKANRGATAVLIEKLFARKHVISSTCARNTHVYHLCARPFYAALGRSDNRNRRERQPLSVKKRLMGLDFVLAHREHAYLATEQEKVEYFSETLTLDREVLPAKLYHAVADGEPTTRYFVDKNPIYIAGDTTSGVAGELGFCFVDEGATTVSGFETYLDQHARLFAALKRFCVVYVAASAFLFPAAERAFQRRLSLWCKGSPTQPSAPLIEYFRARHLYESGDRSSFDRVKLLRLRDQRERFSGPENEALYQVWKADRDREAGESSKPENSPETRCKPAFSTCLLEQNYDFFGSLTAF